MNDEVIYLEADEEITAAIDKLLKLKAAYVRVVVPKRSTLLQSIVNLKLLKKAAADAGKELVLVTADRTATHLAARVGLPVAATLKAQPAIPPATQPQEENTSDIVEGEEEPNLDSGMAASPLAVAKSPKPSFASPMMVRKPLTQSSASDDSSSGPAGEAAKAGPVAAAKAKVPDFNALQKRLLWAAGAVGVLILLFAANYFIKTARVVLYAKGSKIEVNFDFNVDPSARESNPGKAVLAGQNLQSNKELNATVPATGKKDVGTKAVGQITVSNCVDNNTHTLVAGTRFQSSGGKIFRSTESVDVPGGTIFLCTCSPGKKTVAVEADQAGDTYNLAPGKYTLPALPADQQQYMTGQGNQMSGGTTRQVSVVTAADIDKAKGELLAKDKDTAQKDLENKVANGYRALPESFTQTPAEAKANPGVDAEATQTSITVPVSYSELAISKTDFSALLKAQAQDQVGSQNSIYDDGATAAKLTAGKKEANGSQTFSLSTQAYAGAKLDTSAIAKQIQGMRYGDAADTTAKLPGVERSEISLSPFWVSKLPRITSHIKVEVKVAGKGN